MSAPFYYDKFFENPLHFKKKKGSKHEFGVELESITPSDGEIRLLGNRHKQCNYYAIGKIMHFLTHSQELKFVTLKCSRINLTISWHARNQ